MNNKILVIDDEQDLCEILQFNLQKEGYEVVTAFSAEEALEIMRQDKFSLILLDVMMDGMSGFDFAQLLKTSKENAGIPIIFTTALESEENVVKGLNLGADDYMIKPLSMREVKARIQAVLRRTADIKQPPVERELRIDDNAKQVFLGEEPLNLTKLEYELLVLLYNNPGRVFSRDALMDRCWPERSCVLDRTVDVNITRLRKKIGEFGSCIKTRTGYGYVFEK